MSTSGVLARIRAAHPLVHCISNIVTANDCANLALAVGASPMMAQAPEEMEEIAALDVVSMTPIDALNKLFELNEKAKRI